MNPTKFFDIIIKSDIEILPVQVNNLAELIFQPLPDRDEKSIIILSHCNHRYVSIALDRLRFVVSELYKEYKRKGIQRGSTILVSCIGGDNELFTALQFLALTSYGVRVLLPMFLEIDVLSEWLEITRCSGAMMSEREIMGLGHHEIEQRNLASAKRIIVDKNIPFYDLIADFDLVKLLYAGSEKVEGRNDDIVREVEAETSASMEAMVLTTSGSSGKSKLVVYEQGAFIRSCLSFKAAGFFEKEKLGGRGFTPLFSHMMGIRTFMNALWTGSPACLIPASLFLEEPEMARYLLIKTKPEHIIGGPSVYNLFLELMRTFPEIKEQIHGSFKTLISSGAPESNSTIRAFQKAFGIRMHNAFGATETQQALSTLMIDNPDELDLTSLGAPLPGITIGLRKYSEGDDLYSLHIKSPFGMKRRIDGGECVDPEVSDGYYMTGDIVRLVRSNTLVYAGRENVDYFKDGFGVKIPVSSVDSYYSRLLDRSEHVDYYAINSHPGLAALIFINNTSVPPGIALNKDTRNEFSGLISEINNDLYRRLMPFECQHRIIKRIAIVNVPVPRTGKGNPSKYKIGLQFGNLIEQLRDPFSSDLAIKEISSESDDSFTRHLNPYVGHLLKNLAMDCHYHRAKKDTLFTYIDGKEVPVLDALGGYGTNLIGHNNDEMKSALMSFLEEDEVAISDQGSKQKYAGLLAEELNRIVGGITGKDYVVMLGSTGAEAVEIALHHALFEWKKHIEEIEQTQFQKYGAEAGDLCHKVWEHNRTVLSQAPVHVLTLKKAFHGHSSGSRALLGNRKKRDYFSNMLGVTALTVDDESGDWEKELAALSSGATIRLKVLKSEDDRITTEDLNLSSIIAAIAEPVTGEGGIRVVNKDLLNKLARSEYPLIMDEIQCGLGRTGSFLASEGVRADYYLFAKALGGNYQKISAVLISKSRFKVAFGEYYSSTFANSGLACNAALKALSIIEKQNIPQKAKEKGRLISQRLNAVRRKFPDVIEEITGRGLMQGITFRSREECDSIFLRNLYREELLGYVFASYLLKRHNIRILPSLSAPNILRVEPSAFITEEEVNTLAAAIEDLARVVSDAKLYDLLKPLMDDDRCDDEKGKTPRYGWLYNRLDTPRPGCLKVAFIAHFTHPTDELRLIEKDFSRASNTGLRILLRRMQILLQMKPFLLFSKNLFGGKIHFSFYLLPIDTAELEKLNRKGKRRLIVSKIQDAVALAAENGATIVSLGAYTSIITNNGLSLAEPENCKIVTGNALTAASGIRRILDALRKSELRNVTLGIVGAGGNIGSAIASSLIDSGFQFAKVNLFGKGKEKLLNVLKEMEVNGSDLDNVEVSADLSLLKNCNVIISAANTNDPIILPAHINSNCPVYISDLSVPPSISAEVMKMKNVRLLNFASFVRLPQDPDFILCSATPNGTSYCCAAEPILLAFEPVDLPFKGQLTPQEMKAITHLAEKYHLFDGIEEGRTFR